MKRALGIFGCAALLLVGMAWLWNGQAHRRLGPQWVAGEALVQFKAGISDSEAAQLISQAGGTVKEKIPQQRIYVVSFSSGISPQEMVRRFQRMPQVSHAEVNGVVEALGWDLLDPPPAWAESTELGKLGAEAPVRVAVIDTAIDATHPALAGKVVEGYNFVNNTTNTQSTGSGADWHGTASTGRVLDGAGGANVEIMPITVLGSSGSGSWSSVIQGINYAADNGAQVINLSLGGTGYSPLVQQAIDYAVSKGVVVVAAAGNTGRDQAFYPAAYRGVISVAATNEDGKLASFSTYHSSVDLSAPGDRQKLLSHGGYRYSQGTSFAAPFITGMVALLKSAFPSLTGGQVEETLKSKAQDVYGKNPRSKRESGCFGKREVDLQGKLGAGFLNASDVKSWVEQIRAGTFRFPWQTGVPVQPGQPVVQPPQVPARPSQPWLVRGKGNQGAFILTTDGEVVTE